MLGFKIFHVSTRVPGTQFSIELQWLDQGDGNKSSNDAVTDCQWLILLIVNDHIVFIMEIPILERDDFSIEVVAQIMNNSHNKVSIMGQCERGKSHFEWWLFFILVSNFQMSDIRI